MARETYPPFQKKILNIVLLNTVNKQACSLLFYHLIKYYKNIRYNILTQLIK